MLALLCLCAVLLAWWLAPARQTPAKAVPGPRPWPLVGSMHLLGAHANPYQAFTHLSRVYGEIYRIDLGATACVVVSSLRLIKEVLIAKGADFGGRPNFTRFHKLFGGDRNNSLALCDWSSLQKTRRSLARSYCSPRLASLQYERVASVGDAELATFLAQLRALPHGTPCDLKPTVLAACANMFTQYMCSTSFAPDDAQFSRVVRYFDEIFWEINQGYAVDFLPWLYPVYNAHMRKIEHWAREIRHFILARIIDQHRATIDKAAPPRDFTDALLMHLDEDPLMNWQHIIFELEDFLGGHSAIGNLVMVTLAAIVKHPEVARRIQLEVDAVTGGTRCPSLRDKAAMPYTEATIWETLRTASSPIVPHVATKDTEIDGREVKTGTVVFLNNYELNQSSEYWTEPEVFKPERFLAPNGGLVKPAYFIPFSTGKRTCIGQKLVQCFSFVVLATLFQHFDVGADQELKVTPGCVAVPPDCFKLVLTPRH